MSSCYFMTGLHGVAYTILFPLISGPIADLLSILFVHETRFRTRKKEADC